ncbi:MAG: GDP-mannose 4,6-dehydratase, partial [Nitrospirae bacterium]|nr:GDP-mannose 4,6-dehydratase [Nitrospirota bacterium]
GQDGSYLAELLLSKGYEVHGIIRRASTFNTGRIDHMFVDKHDPDARFFLYFGDLSDSSQLTSIIYNVKPDEIYHLGAQSHVRVSFDMPEYTGDVTGLGTTRVLEALRKSGVASKFYQASSSEMFGAAPAPQNELTPFCPRSPYAAAKVYAYWMTVNYREGYDMFACNGILFNHESPRRGETFVTRKVTMSVAAIIAGKQKKLYLGNIDSKRDWGFAPEYIYCQWLILQQDRPGDYAIGTGQTHTVREFVEHAFDYAGVEIEWKGSGVNEKGIVRSLSSSLGSVLTPGDVIIEIDPGYFRPTEVNVLLADITKASKMLNWQPRVTFNELVKIMVDADMGAANLTPPGQGNIILAEKGLNWTNTTTEVRR